MKFCEALATSVGLAQIQSIYSIVPKPHSNGNLGEQKHTGSLISQIIRKFRELVTLIDEEKLLYKLFMFIAQEMGRKDEMNMFQSQLL